MNTYVPFVACRDSWTAWDVESLLIEAAITPGKRMNTCSCVHVSVRRSDLQKADSTLSKAVQDGRISL